MEELEQRVWQRVLAQQGPEMERMDLRPMMLEALETAETYRRLMAKAAGREKEILRRLYEGEMANISCLKGMSALSGTPVEKLKPLPGSKEPGRKGLERCYHRSRRALTEYTARSAESEFGVVFHRMAERERDLCGMVAELLGGLGK